jgi:hypothetical protein
MTTATMTSNSPFKERKMKTLRSLPYALLLFAAALFHHAPAHAGWCSLPDSGAPIITVNPKPFTVPPPSTCLIAASDLSGYTLKATRTAAITASGVQVGNLYDRVYCLGTSGVCDSTNTYLIATRVQMLATPVNFPARNPNCPVWSGTSNDCFEINNMFRNIRGTSGSPIAADVGYLMGSGSSSSTDPDNALAVKYLEYTGKTYKGLNQVTPPGADPADRDNTRAMFWADTNVFDPDGVNSPWSPWFYVRQNCPTGGTGDHFQVSSFAIKYWQGGEETQIQTNIQASAYTCK